MKSNTSSRRSFSAARWFENSVVAKTAAIAVRLATSPLTADGTTRITISFDVPNTELQPHLNTCELLDIIHARRRRKLGSILGGALQRLIPHYATYSVSPASATPAAPPPRAPRRVSR